MQTSISPDAVVNVRHSVEIPFWMRACAAWITGVFPILAVIVAVRLVMTPLFFQLDYQRPGFPDDYYGFTLQDRLNYAPYAVNYLVNGEGIDYLASLTFPDGTALYNGRELQHMRDVKMVATAAFIVATILGTLSVAVVIAVWRNGTTGRAVLARGLRRGALLTFGLIIAIVIGAALAWDRFFTLFHSLFFTEGSWYFAYSDTLIRLFPEAFWFDAALTIGGMTVLFAAIALLVSRRLGVLNNQARRLMHPF